jgi:serine/threonine-protein kinase RsbW
MTAPDGRPVAASLEITSDLQEVRRARAWLLDRLAAAGYPRDMIGEILLAVGEALTNVVRHAYGGQPGHPIHLRLALDPEAVEISLQDESPRSFPVPGYSAPRPEDLAEGGYGLHLIHSLMDGVRYLPGEQGGTTLCLVKRVPPARRSAAS